MVKKFIKNRITFLNIALMLIAMVSFTACGGSGPGQETAIGGDSGTQLGYGSGAPPTTTATPPGGTYEAAEIVVTLECDNCYETYYTFNTDGAEDTPDILYTDPITLTTTTNCVTLRFYSVGYGAEDVKTEIYYLYPADHHDDLPIYSVGGAVSGLADGETVVLQNNGGDDLAITVDGAFSFATKLADGATYDVTILTTPSNQTCFVSNGSRWISGADVTDVSVTCHSPFTDAAVIAGGDSHSIALKNDGTIWAWGESWDDQVEAGGYRGGIRTTPFQISGITDVTAIDGGGEHTLALKNDGTLWAWGSNRYGQLGVETTETCASISPYPCSKTPVQVTGINGVIAVAGGYDHTLAVKTDGTVWAWGYNSYGQLGDGTTTNSITPIQVSGLADVIAVAGGERHSLALKADGTVWAWGASGYGGQLGDGTTTDSATPVQVCAEGETAPCANFLTGVTAILAGNEHTLALKNDGTLRAWGRNYNGQLGDGTTTNSPIPVQVIDLTNVTAIAAGYFHNVVLEADGTLWAWGSNNLGRLGDGTTTDSATPVQVSNLTDVMSVSAGGRHTVAIKTDGTLWAWGYNNYGQLGDGTTTERYTPVAVLAPTP